MEQKFYAKRDSATAMLRKAGADKSQYKDYIFVHADKDNTGLPYAVWMHEGLPLTHAEAFARQELETKKPTKATKKFVKDLVEITSQHAVNKALNAEELKGTDKRTVSGVCRQLVKDGKTNAEIWAVVKKEFKLTDSKKHYPAWYRAELARKGG